MKSEITCSHEWEAPICRER